MAGFPQVDWVAINGRDTPFTKPQHYKKGSATETELTGHDNPLPVANYTQNDNGIWLPTSKDNPVPTQVTGSNVEDVKIKTAYEATAGSRVTIESRYDISDCEKIGADFWVSAEDNYTSHDWRVEIGQLTEAPYGFINDEPAYNLEVANGNRISAESFDVVRRRMRIYLYNDDDSNHLYSCVLSKIKR